jgi:predicted RNA-binding Zn-ribbon protein involved in translation (DUF1610 family)
MPSLTCHCGKRFTVGPKPGRETVDCPACGETVRVDAATPEGSVATAPSRAATAKPLAFGVKVVDGRELEPAATGRTIAFSCPGCGKEFSESRRAAGKPTRCPKCETEFVIPAAGEELRSPTLPARPESKEAGVKAAVAAYTAGKGTAKRRMIAGGRMVPIGFCLILLGGLVSIVGSVLLVKGSLNAFSAAGLGGLGGGAGGGLVGPMADYSKLLQELAGEPGGRRRPAQPRQPLNGLPLHDANQAAKDYQKSLAEQKEKQSSGQTMLIGGVVASGAGMLISFIGGIYLLAGLIGRFIQPQTPVVAANADGTSGET